MGCDTATKVQIKILIQNIYSVTETSMDYSLDIFLRQKWTDPRLKYGNMSELEWLELDSKMMDKVWVPDTYFPNEKTASVHTVTVPNKMMHLYKNGTVLYSTRLSLTLSCSMQLQKYPMDVQKCPIILSSYAYTTENVNYTWEGPNPLKLNYVEMPQFDASIDDEVENRCNNNGHSARPFDYEFACITGFIKLRRKVGYYIVQVFVPSVLIVVVSWVSFWVDHDAVPARISLGVLTVLTMTTQSSGARQSLPQVSYVKAIDTWMSTCLLFVFAALIEYSYVNVVARRRHRPDPDRPVEQQPLTADSKCSTNGSGRSAKVPPNDPKNASNIAARRVDKLSRMLFPLAFFIFNVIFWVYYILIPNPT
ncbi:glycine receptor subunit alpha-2-like [Dreissena polymorpha]|uniref:glycine receptor subunit alpha-2-like n=1 Tax=Dreissena polymorpha TaxID=45954 RepID=UPI0022650CED|nr:glycine receptor subunit alpha-2-like [Dreissena polymorpha]